MKGILFKPWKIKLIADNPDREWVTRRVINPQPPSGEGIEVFSWFAPEIKEGKAPEGLWMEDKNGLKFLQKPRYQVGEVVYIKEAWWVLSYDSLFARIKYLLDDNITSLLYPAGRIPKANPSFLFMPEWAARYFTLIRDVEAERLVLPLSPEELELEGGEQALEMLEKIDGLWVWRYEFKLTERRE